MPKIICEGFVFPCTFKMADDERWALKFPKALGEYLNPNCLRGDVMEAKRVGDDLCFDFPDDFFRPELTEKLREMRTTLENLGCVQFITE